MTITGLSSMSALRFQQASAEPYPGLRGSVDPKTGFLLYYQKIETGRTMTTTGLSGMSALRLFQQASAEPDPGVCVCGSVSEHRVSFVLPENRNGPDHDNHWALRYSMSALCLFQQASAEADLGVGGSVSEHRVSIVLPENRNRPGHDNH